MAAVFVTKPPAAARTVEAGQRRMPKPGEIETICVYGSTFRPSWQLNAEPMRGAATAERVDGRLAPVIRERIEYEIAVIDQEADEDRLRRCVGVTSILQRFRLY